MGTAEPRVSTPSDVQPRLGATTDSQSRPDRRLSSGHRCPQAERHRHDLRSARHPDHRPHPHGAGRGHARDLLPPRAERRQRRRHRRLHDAEAGHLPHGVRARLPERPHRARQRHHQLLPDDPHQRLERARDRRSAAGRLRGDGPARDRQAAVQGRLPRAARRGHRRGHRARHPRRGLGPSGRRVPRPAGASSSRRPWMRKPAGNRSSRWSIRRRARSRPTTP